MSDHHLINDRNLFIQKTISRFSEPMEIEGATGASAFTEYGSAYVNGVLIEGAVYCPTSPFSLLSVGRLFRDHPGWDWRLSKVGPGTLALRAVDEAGAVIIDAVTKDDLLLANCYLGPQRRSGGQPPHGAGGQRARRVRARAMPAFVSAELAAVSSGLAVPATASSDQPNVPVRLPLDSDYWEFAWWHRALGHPSLRVMRWYLKTYPHLSFGRIPSSLSCVACDEGKSHRAAIRAVRAGVDPITVSRGDGASIDIKTSTTPGYKNLRYTAVIVSHRTKYVWVLHAVKQDELADLIRQWYLAYSVRHADANGPLLLLRADNDAVLFPLDGARFWASYGVVLSFSAPYTPAHNGLAESIIRAVFLCARTLLRDSELENYWWTFAVSHAAFLLNRRPRRTAPFITPYERLLRVAPSLPIVGWGSVGHWTPPKEHPAQLARHTFSPRGFGCHFLGYVGDSSTTMLILCHGAVYSTVDVHFPRCGALLLTRDQRSGLPNLGSAAPLAARSEVFDFVASPSDKSCRRSAPSH